MKRSIVVPITAPSFQAAITTAVRGHHGLHWR
jgi:hypothetical protein